MFWPVDIPQDIPLALVLYYNLWLFVNKNLYLFKEYIIMTLYIGGEILHTTRIANYLEKNWAECLLFGVLFFTSCCFIDTSYQYFMCICFACRYIKIAISFVLPFCATIVYYIKRKNLVFIGDIVATVMTLFSTFFLLDCLTFRLTWQIHRAIALYHFVYGGLTFFAVYLASLIVTIKNHKRKLFHNNFAVMNRAFFIGITSFLVVGILMIYIIDRNYFQDQITINFIPTQGAIKNMLSKREVLEIVRNVGNVAFFVGISAMLCELAPKRNKYMLGIVVPTLLSIGMEIYQYILRCGDADVDDVILNIIGAVIGVLIYKNIILRVKEKEIWLALSVQWMLKLIQ